MILVDTSILISFLKGTDNEKIRKMEEIITDTEVRFKPERCYRVQIFKSYDGSGIYKAY